MYRETVAPIYIRVSHAQPVKAAHGVDDREAEPTRQAEISYAVFCLKKKKINMMDDSLIWHLLKSTRRINRNELICAIYWGTR